MDMQDSHLSISGSQMWIKAAVNSFIQIILTHTLQVQKTISKISFNNSSSFHSPIPILYSNQLNNCIILFLRLSLPNRMYKYLKIN